MPPVDFETLAKGAFDEIKCTLGVTCEYLPKRGGRIEIQGVFDDRAQEVDPDTEINISSNIFTLGVKFNDLPAKPAKGDRVKIKNKYYQVIDSLEDGVPEASTVLVLHEIKGRF